MADVEKQIQTVEQRPRQQVETREPATPIELGRASIDVAASVPLERDPALATEIAGLGQELAVVYEHLPQVSRTVVGGLSEATGKALTGRAITEPDRARLLAIDSSPVTTRLNGEVIAMQTQEAQIQGAREAAAALVSRERPGENAQANT